MNRIVLKFFAYLTTVYSFDTTDTILLRYYSQQEYTKFANSMHGSIFPAFYNISRANFVIVFKMVFKFVFVIMD